MGTYNKEKHETHIWLVVYTYPSEKYEFVSWDMILNTWKKVKFMFQTTNQHIFMSLSRFPLLLANPAFKKGWNFSPMAAIRLTSLVICSQHQMGFLKMKEPHGPWVSRLRLSNDLKIWGNETSKYKGETLGTSNPPCFVDVLCPTACPR